MGLAPQCKGVGQVIPVSALLRGPARRGGVGVSRRRLSLPRPSVGASEDLGLSVGESSYQRICREARCAL
eukprot:13443275-Alexandrium_andersonii.AAC.1